MAFFTNKDEARRSAMVIAVRSDESFWGDKDMFLSQKKIINSF